MTCALGLVGRAGMLSYFDRVAVGLLLRLKLD